MVKAWSAMDTPALLGRDLLTFPKVLKVLQLAEPILPYPKKPLREILYPKDFMPEDSPEQVRAMQDFIEDIGKAGGYTHRQISIQKDWQKTSPVEEKDLQEYLHYVSFELLLPGDSAKVALTVNSLWLLLFCLPQFRGFQAGVHRSQWPRPICHRGCEMVLVRIKRPSPINVSFFSHVKGI